MKRQPDGTHDAVIMVKIAWFIAAFLIMTGPAHAQKPGTEPDVSPLSARQAKIFSQITPLFPDGRPDHSQPEIKNSTRWNIRIWTLNEAEECTYENFHSACRGHTLYVTVADDEVGGKVFAFRTKKAFRWIVDGISEGMGGAPCALFHLRERFPSKKGTDGWAFRRVSVCASPRGFAR